MKKLKDLTLREKLGQLIMVGFENTEFDEHLRTIIEDYKIGNFYIMLLIVKIQNKL